MDILKLLRQYAQYNLWANSLMAEWLSTFNDQHFKAEITSSFSSVQKTVLHICDAEYVWYQRLTGQSLDAIPSKDFTGGMSDALNLLTRYSIKILDFIQLKKMKEISEIIQYRHFNGTDSMPVYYMIHHCMNHSTYHRGQLVTLGRQLGYENPPKTDFIHFIREKQLHIE